jgi:hypothetical protein
MRFLAYCLAAATAIATALALALTLVGAPPAGHAQSAPDPARLSTAEVIDSDEILAASVVQIRELGRRETEALARALADCQEAPTPNALVDSQCRRARAYFEIVATPYGPLGALFGALGVLFTWTDAEWQRQDTPLRAHLVLRIARIEGAWGAAVHYRLLGLDRDRQ